MVLQGCGAAEFEKKFSLVEPEDLANIRGAVLKYSGTVGDMVSWQGDDRTERYI